MTLTVADDQGAIASDDVVLTAREGFTTDPEDGLYLTFAQSGYNVEQQENIPLHPQGSFETAGVGSWTEDAVSTIEYNSGTKIEVRATKMWWGNDRSPMTIEFIDGSSNTVGSIDYNPQSYSGNAVNFYKNGALVYSQSEINPDRSYSHWEGSSPSMNGKLYGYFEFLNDKIKFNSYRALSSFGVDFDVEYDLTDVKHIRITSKALGTYSTGRAGSYAKLLPVV